MREVVEFCKEEDPAKPDFLGRLVDEGVIRRECAGSDKAPLTEHERSLLKNQISQYYKDNWSRVILQIMRYKNPLIANVNQMTSLSEKMHENQEIYFHIDWVKPGRHVYAIEHTPEPIYSGDEAEKEGKMLEEMRAKIAKQKGLGKKADETFYVHEMLAGFRTDDVPPFCKTRSVRQVLHDFYKPKPVFKNFVKDTPEILASCMNNDARLLRIDKICEGRADEEKIIDKQVRINYQVIKDIFTLLQSRSKTYPYVDTFAFRHYFIRDLGLLEDGHYKIANFDLLLNETAANNAQLDGMRIPNGSFCRFQFIELCIKMGKFLYSTGYMYRQGGRHKLKK